MAESIAGAVFGGVDDFIVPLLSGHFFTWCEMSVLVGIAFGGIQHTIIRGFKAFRLLFAFAHLHGLLVGLLQLL